MTRNMTGLVSCSICSSSDEITISASLPFADDMLLAPSKLLSSCKAIPEIQQWCSDFCTVTALACRWTDTAPTTATHSRRQRRTPPRSLPPSTTLAPVAQKSPKRKPNTPNPNHQALTTADDGDWMRLQYRGTRRVPALAGGASNPKPNNTDHGGWNRRGSHIQIFSRRRDGGANFCHRCSAGQAPLETERCRDL